MRIEHPTIELKDEAVVAFNSMVGYIEYIKCKIIFTAVYNWLKIMKSNYVSVMGALNIVTEQWARTVF